VWITGASSGIGRELALRVARTGARVAASARTATALEELARLDPLISAYPVDVTNTADMIATAKRIEADIGPIDLTIFNAGVWKPMGASRLSAEAGQQSMAVNYGGILNGLEAVLPAMIAREAGHVALVASVAGFAGLPKGAAYGPTKAAVINLAESLAPDLARKNVQVSLICPGFVDTPMTRVNTFPMPFMIPADEAANRIVQGLQARKFEITFPWQMALLMKLARRAPYPIYFWIAKTFLTPSSNRAADGTINPDF
jgi:short-subunit dehydrogenase